MVLLEVLFGATLMALGLTLTLLLAKGPGSLPALWSALSAAPPPPHPQQPLQPQRQAAAAQHAQNDRRTPVVAPPRALTAEVILAEEETEVGLLSMLEQEADAEAEAPETQDAVEPAVVRGSAAGEAILATEPPGGSPPVEAAKVRRRRRAKTESTDAAGRASNRVASVIRALPALQRRGTTASLKEESESRSLTLLRGGIVFSPQCLGHRDLLVGGGKLLEVLPAGDPRTDALVSAGLVTIIDVTDYIVTPGLVDIHVHVTGGGGELGPESRTPEARLSELLSGGITTVVGVLGTDSISRTPEVLLTKVRALNNLPMSAYMYSGSYRCNPVRTVTGDIQTDLAFLEPVIGVGEIAISDHRGSQPSADVLRKLVSDVRVGGMLSGKCGIAYFHVGKGKTMLSPLWDIVRNTALPFKNILPTHVSRTYDLARDGAEWIRAGGNVDMTVNSKLIPVLEQYMADGIPLDHVSISSDSYGSVPRFSKTGELIGYSYAHPSLLLSAIKKMHLERAWPMERILPLVTSNPARFLGLPKGTLEVGCDADILVMDRESLEPQYVLAKGILALTPNSVMRDFGEPTDNASQPPS